MKWTLELKDASLAGPELPRSIELMPAKRLVIGRGDAADVTMKPNAETLAAVDSEAPLDRDKVLSRTHLALTAGPETVALEVFGRTEVDGAEVTEGRNLSAGAEISIGPSQFGCVYTLQKKRSPPDEEEATKKTKMVSFRELVGSPVFGTLALGVDYPSPRPSREETVAMLRQAVENGVKFFDTADTYCRDGSDLHYVENVIRETVPDILVGTKGGMDRRNATNRGWFPSRMSPEIVREKIRASKRALGGDQPLALWQFHHCDSLDVDGSTKDRTTFTNLLGAARSAVQDGDVRRIGLCNCSVAHARVALEVLGSAFVSVQNPFSLYDRTAEKPLPSKIAKSNKMGMLTFCRDNGLVFFAYQLFGGISARNGKRNLDADFPSLTTLAADKSTTPAALVLAWLHHKYPQTAVALIGTRSLARVPALRPDVVLSPAEFKLIDTLAPPKGRR